MTLEPHEQTYYAHRNVSRQVEGELYYTHPSLSVQHLRLYLMDHPIVQVRIRERQEGDPPSRYWGWVDTQRPDRYTMVWPSEIQLNMCFPYGPEASSNRGYGRKVNLVIEEVPTGT